MAKFDPRGLLNKLNELERLRDPSKVSGQRQYLRFVVRGEAELQPMDRLNRLDSKPVSISLRDVGRGGLGFLSSQPLEVASTWRVSFLQQNQVIGQQGILIRHCQKIDENVYLVGSQFCIETGLMHLLGVDPGVVTEGDAPACAPDGGVFLPPGEVP